MPGGIEAAESVGAAIVRDNESRLGHDKAVGIGEFTRASAFPAETAHRPAVTIEKVESLVLVVKVNEGVAGEHRHAEVRVEGVRTLGLAADAPFFPKGPGRQWRGIRCAIATGSEHHEAGE